VQWVFFGFSFAFGWFSKGWGDGSWVGLRDVGQEPFFEYAPTIPAQTFCFFQMTFAVSSVFFISYSSKSFYR
jgi:Amt family ammonium transporter